MRKEASHKTIAKKCVALIYDGNTWEYSVETLGLAKVTLQRYLKEYYKDGADSWAYRKLCKIARDNKKAKKTNKRKKVLVIETGAILVKEVLAEVKNIDSETSIFMPGFCVRELLRFLNKKSEAKEALDFIYSTDKIVQVNPDEGILYVEPDNIGAYKRRSEGIVKLACELDSVGYDVTVVTNSREVQVLTEMQGIKVRKVFG